MMSLKVQSSLVGQYNEMLPKVQPSLVGRYNNMLLKVQPSLIDRPVEYISCPELFNAETGGTERNLAEVLSGSGEKVVILDNIDAIACKISNVSANSVEHRMNSVLRKFLDMESCLIIGVTSNIDYIDTTLLRSGRFSNHVHVSVSKTWQRRLLLQEIVSVPELTNDLVDLISEKTNGYSAADLEKMYMLAAFDAHKKNSTTIVRENFEHAISSMRPSIVTDLPTIPISRHVEDLVGVDDLKKQIMVRISLSY